MIFILIKKIYIEEIKINLNYSIFNLITLDRYFSDVLLYKFNYKIEFKSNEDNI